MIEKVINGGYCIGCGVCTLTHGSPFKITMDPEGRFQAYLDAGYPAGTSTDNASVVCPFSDSAVDENEIARVTFGQLPGHHPSVGDFISCYAGHVEEAPYRANGSSGGIGSWILCEMLHHGLADHVIHVHSLGADTGMLFGYKISSTADEVRSAAKSKYYPIEMSQVLQEVRNRPGRYVLVGVPCFIKAARLICRTDQVLNERLRWFVGLVCGHLKSRRFPELLAWQMGVPPRELRGFDFRVKLPDSPASRYGVEAHGHNGTKEIRVQESITKLYGTDWGHGLFKYKACDYCDDVIAETADVVIGDAWLPQYSADPKGTNIVVTRREELDRLLTQGREAGRLKLDSVSAETLARSQESGLRHRRNGLQYRLLRTSQRQEWTPRKRNFPNISLLTRTDKARHDLRERIRDESHRAFLVALQKNDLTTFMACLKPLTGSLNYLRKPFHVRMREKFSRILRRLLNKPPSTSASHKST